MILAWGRSCVESLRATLSVALLLWNLVKLEPNQYGYQLCIYR
ncbi:hypothetical protein PR003_g5312 [Phytophthora rubi]|uniref:Uncharacterized protein n=1 Tax=Phytophthora rubi TaxID=129364 RepID=A0A6A3N4E4_9STRA|nr:hypothetical protein PR002_g5670 [Phytophthora rubi]KAE9044816.1 hypothetical protein PR001_g5215 [Phytophthora rubi]KAE9350573.1 hypothetical protein PR003_g5312 [Phytophthora rubi]